MSSSSCPDPKSWENHFRKKDPSPSPQLDPVRSKSGELQGQFCKELFFPICQARVFRFYVSCRRPPRPPPPPPLNRKCRMAVSPAGPQPRASAGSVPRRTSTASQKIRQIQRQKECQKICQRECQKIRKRECHKECQKESVRRYARKNVSKYARKNIRKNVRRHARENAEIMFQYMPENLSD